LTGNVVVSAQYSAELNHVCASEQQLEWCGFVPRRRLQRCQEHGSVSDRETVVRNVQVVEIGQGDNRSRNRACQQITAKRYCPAAPHARTVLVNLNKTTRQKQLEMACQ
jgi:hypothetical protein